MFDTSQFNMDMFNSLFAFGESIVNYPTKSVTDVLYAAIDAPHGTTTTIVEGAEGKKIVVLSLVLTYPGIGYNDSTRCVFQSHSNTPSVLGVFYITPTSPIIVINPYGLLSTEIGESLDLAVDVSSYSLGGQLTYILV